MGILFKLLCPGDVPPKAHKLLLNSSRTSLLYDHICFEEHHVDVVYPLSLHDFRGIPLLDNTTKELIEHKVLTIWGQYDRMVWDWEILLRELLFCNLISAGGTLCLLILDLQETL